MVPQEFFKGSIRGLITGRFKAVWGGAGYRDKVQV